jgi:sugar/nucleoside kinase (ribokinase family)
VTLVGVGHALADAFAFVGEDVPKTLGLHPGSFAQVPDYRMQAILSTLKNTKLQAGGSAANTVKLAARLGVDAHFVGQCGHDAAGHVFESELLEAGVKVNLTRSDAPTGRCVTFLCPSEGRTVATFRSASGNLAPGLVGDTLLKAATVVVAEGYLLDEPAFLADLLERCQTLGTPVAVDTSDNPMADVHREDLLKHLEAGRIHYLFIQESDAAALTGVELEDSFAALGHLAPVVVVKHSDLGWRLVSEGILTIPAEDSVPLDPSGVGDGFQAGFFWALGQGWATEKACRAGALVAGAIEEQAGTKVEADRWTRLVSDLNALV